MLDCLFPFFCLGCDNEGTILCNKCQATLPVLGIFVSLENASVLDDHIAVGIFEENNLLGKLIYAYKYNFVTDVLKVFEKMIQDFLQHNKKFFDSVDIVIPVPLHRRRYAERGFNQAEEIAKVLSRELNIEMQNVLIRKNATKQQAKLHKKEREQNVSGAFELQQGIDVQNKHILLVDDVFTTGSTLSECARVIKEHGATEVRAFTLARG